MEAAYNNNTKSAFKKGLSTNARLVLHKSRVALEKKNVKKQKRRMIWVTVANTMSHPALRAAFSPERDER